MPNMPATSNALVMLALLRLRSVSSRSGVIGDEAFMLDADESRQQYERRSRTRSA